MQEDEIVLGPLPAGITRAGEGMLRRTWNVLGHTYRMKAVSDTSFAFETLDPPGTGVPPHVHPTQDEHIYVLEGVFTLYLDGQWETAGPGDTVLMPRGLPHAYYNRSEADTRALFWVSPAGRLAQLFDQLHDLTDPAEVVRLSAQHDVDFLPPGSVPGGLILDLGADPVDLCAALVDVPSVSGDEATLADAVEAALREQAPHLEVLRSGDAVLARTRLGRERRVLLAGHLDTVPIAGNVPSRRDGDLLYGCGTSDMKAGDAVFAHLAATVTAPRHDLTLVFYDCEEVEAVRNGLGRIEREHRDWLDADLAILGEPTNGAVEAGCQGTLRVEVTLRGRRAHSARSWLGDNAVHAAGEVLRRLAAYPARDVDIDGCVYREGLQAVGIRGGVAGNVVPDECLVTVNFRFAPDRTVAAAEEHVREVLDGFDVRLTDSSPGALPGLAQPAAREFLAATGTTASAKYGWTDVSRFAALGIPALNYGPGDPNLAHTRDEHVDVRLITSSTAALRAYLT